MVCWFVSPVRTYGVGLTNQRFFGGPICGRLHPTSPNRMSLGQGWVLVGFKGFYPGIRISGVFTSGNKKGKKIKITEIKPS